MSEAVQVTEKFKDLIGQRPKRARVGYGSFLTLDFGQASRRDHKLKYEWQIWIQQSDWKLLETPRDFLITDSEAKRGPMQVAIARLEKRMLERVVHDFKSRETRFIFSGGVELLCRPYSNAAPDEDCWALYTPDYHVLKADSQGRVRYIRSDIPEPNRTESKERNTGVPV